MSTPKRPAETPADIIQERQYALGPEGSPLSYHDLERLTKRFANSISASTIGNWRRGKFRGVDPTKLEVAAEAWADERRPRTELLRDLRAAFKQPMGVGSTTLEMHELAGLKLEQRRHVEQLIRLFYAANRGALDTDGDGASTGEPVSSPTR